MTRNLFFQVSLLLIVIFCNIQCKSKKKESYQPNPIAIALDNKAFASVRWYYHPDSMIKAIQLLDSAIMKDPNYLLAYAHKAEYLTRLGKTSQAIETLNTYLHLNPTNPYVLHPAGMLYEKTGNKKEAMVYYKRATVYFRKLYEKDGNPMHELNRCVVIWLIHGTAQGKAAYQEEREKLAENEKQLKVNDDIVNTYFNASRKQYIKDFWTK